MTTRFHISGMVHVNINVSNFDRSRTFYEVLGFKLVWRVPETVRGGLMALDGAAHPVVIDLLEWETPRDPAPPYAHLYHYGLARLALSTTDMNADLATLSEMGVELIGPPARVVIDGQPSGGRFVCFKDPDGTILELVEAMDLTMLTTRPSGPAT